MKRRYIQFIHDFFCILNALFLTQKAFRYLSIESSSLFQKIVSLSPESGQRVDCFLLIKKEALAFILAF